MLTGSIFIKDSQVNFIAHPWVSLIKALKSNELSFIHQDLISNRLDRLSSSGNLYKAQSILLDLITMGPQINIPLDNLKTEYFELSLPTIPMEIWMPQYRESHEIYNNLEEYYSLLSYETLMRLNIKAPSIELEEFNSRIQGNMKLFNTLQYLFITEIEKSPGLTERQKTMYSMVSFEAINSFIFSSKSSGDIKSRNALYEYLRSQGKDIIKWFDLTLKVNIQGFPKQLKTISMNGAIFDHFFKEDYSEIMESLLPARIHPQLESEARDRKNPAKGVIEYYMENIIRAQRDPISKFGVFLKQMAIKYASEGKKLEILPFFTYQDGLSYSLRSNIRYLSYFPKPFDLNAEQKFILDGKDLKSFKSEYKKFLGGLLIDHQTFIVRTIDVNGNYEYLCCFNLLYGAIDIEHYFARPITIGYVSAPEINHFNPDLYDPNNPNNIIDVMGAFEDVLIGYQRMGASMSDERKEEMLIWEEICSRLPYIDNIFDN